MEKFILDGQGYKDIVTNGCASLRKNYKEIDALNVFPVPDGDTGINMRMTIESGANEIKNNEDNSIYNVAKQFSRGMLMGARGNSGVILSQFFRGIYKGLAGYDKVNAVELAAAFERGVAQAYKAVMKPVEGTILTVAREAAAYASSVVTTDFSIQAYFEAFLKEAREYKSSSDAISLVTTFSCWLIIFRRSLRSSNNAPDLLGSSLILGGMT